MFRYLDKCLGCGCGQVLLLPLIVISFLMGSDLFAAESTPAKKFSKVYHSRAGESFKSYLHRLLPNSSSNRGRLFRYARNQGVKWAPLKVEQEDRLTYRVTWQLDHPKASDNSKTYMDRIQVVSLTSGEFLINGKAFHIRPLSGVLRDLELVEGLLTPSKTSSLIGDSWQPRDRREDPWPREKGAIHLLPLMYSIYFSHPEARCSVARMALAHAMIGADAELHEIPRCDGKGVEVVVREQRMGPWLHLQWEEGHEETMAAREVSQDGVSGREIQYFFNSLGLKGMAVRHPGGRMKTYSTQFGSPSLVSPQMMMEFRRRYVLIERVRNAGSDWGFTCNNGCQKDLVASLANKRIIAKPRKKKYRRRRPASKTGR